MTECLLVYYQGLANSVFTPSTVNSSPYTPYLTSIITMLFPSPHPHFSHFIPLSLPPCSLHHTHSASHKWLSVFPNSLLSSFPPTWHFPLHSTHLTSHSSPLARHLTLLIHHPFLLTPHPSFIIPFSPSHTPHSYLHILPFLFLSSILHSPHSSLHTPHLYLHVPHISPPPPSLSLSTSPLSHAPSPPHYIWPALPPWLSLHKQQFRREGTFGSSRIVMTLLARLSCLIFGQVAEVWPPFQIVSFVG